MLSTFTLMLLRLAAILLSGIVLVACATTDTAATAKAICQELGPRSWSRNDTEATQLEIVEHNRVWNAVCRKYL